MPMKRPYFIIIGNNTAIKSIRQVELLNISMLFFNHVCIVFVLLCACVLSCVYGIPMRFNFAALHADLRVFMHMQFLFSRKPRAALI